TNRRRANRGAAAEASRTRPAAFADCYPGFDGDAGWDFGFRVGRDDDSPNLARPEVAKVALDSRYPAEHFQFRRPGDAGLVSGAGRAQPAPCLWPVVTEPD